jgi:hypothetical protein
MVLVMVKPVLHKFGLTVTGGDIPKELLELAGPLLAIPLTFYQGGLTIPPALVCL